ncbi:MAG TPA: toll/interleukin-1 receptor domain-containing protein, partial [Rheinheimera sp.]|uniref:toll/interleukin-1 receptor domain-containing protein n=1 Tax=Rheinheimera sp. TaxID=1869214 RepID=UPI002B48D787
MSSDEIPSVLVSYSWDSEDHKTWVREISQRLRLNGVDVKLDQWHVQPGQSLTQFMEREIVECDHVI